jgi:hypothetical protein
MNTLHDFGAYQVARTGKLTMGSSLRGAIVSRVM